MNETQEFGACTSIVTELRFTGMNANQSRELEGPIVAALCRHYFLEPDAVIVLGHRTVSEQDNDAHADDLRRLNANPTLAVVDLELRQRTNMANATAARTALPMDPWVMEALREEFLENGAADLGIDVGAVEISLKFINFQVDTHAPTPTPTPAPTVAPNDECQDLLTLTCLVSAATSLMGSMTGSQDGPRYLIFVVAAAGALTALFTAYVLRVRHRSHHALLDEDGDKESFIRSLSHITNQVLNYKVTLENVNFQKLMEDVELFEATKQTVVAGLARKAGVSESSVEVAFSAGSVKVDASIQVPPELAKDAAAIMAELTKPSNGSELLQSLAAQPKFHELKEDPREDFTVSDISVEKTVVDNAPEQGPGSDNMITSPVPAFLRSEKPPWEEEREIRRLALAEAGRAGYPSQDEQPTEGMRSLEALMREATESLEDHAFLTPKKKTKKKKKRSGMLIVNVKAASNLRNADGGFLSGKSDCFVVVTVPSDTDEAHRAETEVINESLNPAWNEQKEFAINQPQSTVGSIRFEVFDSDVLGNTPLGFIEVPWPFWRKGDDNVFCRKAVSLDLKSEEGQPEATGKLECDLEWRPAPKKKTDPSPSPTTASTHRSGSERESSPERDSSPERESEAAARIGLATIDMNEFVDEHGAAVQIATLLDAQHEVILQAEDAPLGIASMLSCAPSCAPACKVSGCKACDQVQSCTVAVRENFSM
jgi:hypothetical protein